MNILVCLKMVSRSTYSDTFAESASADRLSGGQLGLNPADAYTLEQALRIKDRRPATRITVITMAPKTGEQILREALAMGADEAVHVSDIAYAGSDTIATAGVLAAAIASLGRFDLILCGRKAIDSETGHIGAQLSQALGVPFLSNVLSLVPGNGAVEAICALSDGTAKFRCPCPVLLTVINGTDMVRAPMILGLRRAKNVPIRLVTTATVPAVRSGTETISVTELSFAHRHGEKETDLQRGIERLVKLL